MCFSVIVSRARAVIRFAIDGWVPTGAPKLRVDATNLLDERIYASGYSYLYATRGPGGDVPGQKPGTTRA